MKSWALGAVFTALLPSGVFAQEARTITGWTDDPVPVFRLDKGTFIETGTQPASELAKRGTRLAREERGYALLPGAPPVWVELSSMKLYPKARAARDVCNTVGATADQSLAASLGGRDCKK